MRVSDLEIVNNQRVKKALFRGESYWNQQPEDSLLILLSGDLTVHYVDRSLEMASIEIPVSPAKLLPFQFS